MRKLKVFLCHASNDKAIVQELYKKLTDNGIDAWLDKEKLLPGEDWEIEIPKAVEESDIVIVCMSSKSITKEGFVQKEIRLALDTAEKKPDETIYIIPCRLDECDVPRRLSKWHYIDLYFENKHLLEDNYRKLLLSLAKRAEQLGIEFLIDDPEKIKSFDEEMLKRGLYQKEIASWLNNNEVTLTDIETKDMLSYLLTPNLATLKANINVILQSNLHSIVTSGFKKSLTLLLENKIESCVNELQKTTDKDSFDIASMLFSANLFCYQRELSKALDYFWHVAKNFEAAKSLTPFYKKKRRTIQCKEK